MTSDDKELYFKGMGFTFSSSSGASTTQRGAPDYILKLTEFPKFKPAYNFIRIDPENNIWIRPWSHSKQIGPASFDAFRPDGTFIGAVEIAKDSRLPNRIVRQGSCFWGITVDKDGEYTIAKMRIEAAKSSRRDQLGAKEMRNESLSMIGVILSTLAVFLTPLVSAGQAFPAKLSSLDLKEDLTIGVREGDEYYMFGNSIMVNADDRGNIYVTDWDRSSSVNTIRTAAIS